MSKLLRTENSGLNDGPQLESRRATMKMLGAGLALASSGCVGLAQEAKPGRCEPVKTPDLIIDMHCHIMNLEDADRAVFVKGHILNTDEGINRAWDWIADLAIRVVQQPAVFFVDEAREERDELRKVFGQMRKSEQDFCNMAAKLQDGIIFADETRNSDGTTKISQPTGFLSNRARNAARYMATFPAVDLFLPSMVDFYEGDSGNYSSILEQAHIYSLLSVASNGRMLPLISFHPGRGFVPGSDPETVNYHQNVQLNFIKYAVENLGFVGVKIHPSTGFAPIDNLEHMCRNPGADYGENSREELAAHFERSMEGLYRLCRQLDIPLLTHGSLGVLGPDKCIREKNTFSPSKWAQAVAKANAEPLKDEKGNKAPELRVCIAHFANRFKEAKNSIGLEPSDWLLEAAREISPHGNIFLDLSEVSGWYDSSTGKIDGMRKEAFAQLMLDYPDLSKRLMYGTDWHMPDAAAIGSNYLPGMKKMLQETIPKDFKATIGGNAATFFGLREGQTTRKRVDNFLKSSGVKIENIEWRKKTGRV